jgi:Regulator of ribonuclease activity B
MISRDALQDMFDYMRARARWSIDGVCLWGYFFTDYSRERLMTAVPALERMGYRFVDILDKPTPQDDDQLILYLHVEREEQHTVDSLDTRNRELERFAAEFQLEHYDGMDVGPITRRNAS